MKVSLVNFTPQAMETAFYAFRNMHNEVGTEITDFESKEQKLQFLDTLSKIPHQTVLEYAKTVWYIEGSRAFQQQLTRTRLAGYSIQSLRIVNVDTFADDGYYYTPPNLNYGSTVLYDAAMKASQEYYKEIMANGAPVEVARGVLPLNILSPITMTINLRSLTNMMELRMCKNAQSEFVEIAKLMKKEVEKKIDRDFARIFFKAPCQKIGYCPSPVPCDLVPEVFKRAIVTDSTKIGIMG